MFLGHIAYAKKRGYLTPEEEAEARELLLKRSAEIREAIFKTG
jgi:hypothetical protein